MHRNHLFGAAAVAALLMFSACAPSTAGQTDAPTSSSPPATTAPPEAWSPTSAYGLECTNLVDEALALGAFSVPVSAVDPLVTASGVGVAIPRRTSILSQGGSVCEWSNGVPVNSQYGGDPAYAGVTVSVLPKPAAGWSAQAAHYGMPADSTACAPDMCTMSRVVGDAWLTLEAFGGTVATIDPTAAQALLDAAVASVTAAGAPSPTATPSRTVPPLPTDCEAVLPLDTVRTITGDASAEPAQGGGGWSDWAEARLVAGNDPCRWATGDENAATIDWIRDGRWAYDRSREASTFVPTTIAGLGAGDEATIRCDAAFGTTCAVDLALGPDWLNVAGSDEATAIALAEAVVAQLAP